MTSQSATGVASTYEWTADNRLKKATVASGDFRLPPQEVHYKYDYAGRRLLKHVGAAGQRTRHFFNGLTEEIKKVSRNCFAESKPHPESAVVPLARGMGNDVGCDLGHVGALGKV